jgi:hypothetical protein
MTYTLLRGEFVIRYPDLPRQGPEPDGDTVKFAPATSALVETLPRPSGGSPGLNARGISVRLEAIDALETHFQDTHQELAGANAARDELLRLLGFTGVTFFDDLPNKVASADADRLPGYVLSNGIDANGRLIGFVFPGDPGRADGAQVFLQPDEVGLSANAALLRSGLAYPAFYSTLPADLRLHVADLARAAQTAADPAGLWPRSTADPNGAATVADLAQLETLVLWPKLFRRLVPYLAAGFDGFDDLDAWLRADPVNRDDSVFLLSRGERGNLHDVVTGRGHTVQLTAWPWDFIIEPDPTNGPGPAPTPVPVPVPVPVPGTADSLLIVAALPDPAGTDAGHETVTLINPGATSVDLTGWTLGDAGGSRQPLSGVVAAGDTVRIVIRTPVRLGNTGDTVLLTDPTDRLADRLVYTQEQTRSGRSILAHR